MRGFVGRGKPGEGRTSRVPAQMRQKRSPGWKTGCAGPKLEDLRSQVGEELLLFPHWYKQDNKNHSLIHSFIH